LRHNIFCLIAGVLIWLDDVRSTFYQLPGLVPVPEFIIVSPELKPDKIADDEDKNKS